MAVKTLKSFLIGIGWDTTKLEEGDRKIQGSLSGVKSRTLATSAAIIGAYGAVAASVIATSDRVDQLALRTQNMRTGINRVYDFGNAVRLAGGDVTEATEALAKFEEIQNNLRLKGEAGPINDLAMAGIDVSALYKAQDGSEFLRILSDMMPNLDEGQRAVVQQSLGLSDAVMRSISGGFDQLSQAMDKANSLTGNVDQLVENSRKLKESTATLGLTIEGVTNELAEKFQPGLIKFTGWLNDWISEHRGDISRVIDTAADNPGATTALGASAGASLTGAALSKIGLSGTGGMLGKGGMLGSIVSGSYLLTDAVFDRLEQDADFRSASDAFDQKARDWGLGALVDFSDMVFGKSASDSVNPATGTTVPFQSQDDLVRAQQAAKINVANQVNLKVELDGRAIDARIIEVNGRQNYDTVNELQTTTDR